MILFCKSGAKKIIKVLADIKKNNLSNLLSFLNIKQVGQRRSK